MPYRATMARQVSTCVFDSHSGKPRG
ncbi:unnamed protein product [Acanthoscelides obtectus]|uniref:Uncharacterized protein n=1 Tax=Acanthoscelides obtectus TaxID=200917 RepID=A0A9P0PKQ9_ACAOB|nr:unnamed protein product [Acanthoscelides obtectus]CAK1638329.1 hypothetical protein AOBTE_LOCUS10542 [Acanthoscelides obtectus]